MHAACHAGTDAAPQPIQVSLRLEGMSLNDTEAGLLAAWGRRQCRPGHSAEALAV